MNLRIQSLHPEKSRVDPKWYKSQYVYWFYILLCWSVYYIILTLFCLKFSENFNPFHFSHTISYTFLNSNITDFPLTYHIMVSSLEFYIHLITFSISWQCFVPCNQILHCSCNIGTAAHILFTKSQSSELQEYFGKVLYPLGFLQFHPICISIQNAWFSWLHTIWICKSMTLLLSFHEFIFPHNSPIIWLFWSCHICCLYFSFFFYSNDLLLPLHIFLLGYC